MQRLGQGLGVEATSPIVPLIVGSEAAALKASAQLLQRGFYVPAIRPPTVAPGTSRQVFASTCIILGSLAAAQLLDCMLPKHRQLQASPCMVFFQHMHAGACANAVGHFDE